MYRSRDSKCQYLLGNGNESHFICMTIKTVTVNKGNGSHFIFSCCEFYFAYTRQKDSTIKDESAAVVNIINF